MIVSIIAHLLTYTKLSTKVGAIVARVGAFAIYGLLAYGLYCWAYDNGKDDERARWEAAAAKIEAADVKADAAGTITAAQTKGKIDATNERAAEVARGSDDPLAAGIGELRRQGSGKGN